MNACGATAHLSADGWWQDETGATDVATWQTRLFSSLVRIVVRRRDWGSEAQLTRRARTVFAAPAWYGALMALGLRRRRVASDVIGEWLEPAGARRGVLLYVHGGGFVSCSEVTHRPITAALARYCKRRVFSADYRLAPGHRFPAALDDVSAVYSWLQRQAPGSRSRWQGIQLEAPSVVPEASPLYGDASGLPPLLLQVGSTELLLDDSPRFEQRVRAAGGSCRLEVCDGAFHGWHMLVPFVPEARTSLRNAARFIAEFMDVAPCT